MSFTENGYYTLPPDICIQIDAKNEQDLLQEIQTTQYPSLAHFQAFFHLFGITSEHATIAIPFLNLKGDVDYNIPFVARRVRLTNRSSEQIEGPIILPEFEHVIADVLSYIPLDDASVDLFVLNHGVVVSLLAKKQQTNFYKEVRRVTKPGSIILGFDYSQDPECGDENPSIIAKRLGMPQVHILMLETILQALHHQTGQDAKSLEEFFKGEWNRELFFLRKPLHI